MKFIKSLIARILAIWALFVFATTMFVFFPFYMLCFIIPEPQKTRYHRFLSQLWMGTFLFLSGCIVLFIDDIL